MRPSQDSLFMSIASVMSTRATCPRKHVGAVIVQRGMVIASGYNGSVRGQPHCEDVGCMMEDNHCVRVVHAELNALTQAARTGASVEGATLYCTASPCWACFKVIANAGIVRVVYSEFYRDERSLKAASECGIEMVQYSHQ